MIRIVIADDHAVVREGVRQIMEKTPDIKVTGEAANDADLRAVLLKYSCDVILLDLNLPGSMDHDLIAALTKEHPDTPIVVLSFHDEGPVVAGAMKAGASGYVTKGSPLEVLIEAIRKAAAGNMYVDTAVVNGLIFGNLAPGSASTEKRLTGRELQILRMIEKGMRLGEIADALYVSPKTISTHKANLMQKVGSKNNADLIRYAAKHGLRGD